MSESDLQSQQTTWDDMRDYLDNLKDGDMVRAVTNLQNDMQRMGIENAIFENFLSAQEPSLIAGMAKTMAALSQMRERFMSSTSLKSNFTTGADSQSIGSVSVVSKRQLVKTKGPRINYSQKTDLILREIERMQSDMAGLQQFAHRRKNKLRAEIEENGIRGAEIDETRQRFEQEIVVEAVEALTQKIPAEKFVRYMHEWLKAAQITLEKLRLRTSSLYVQDKKLKALLIQKEDVGESVHEVDFEKLGIENKNFLEIIEQKNSNLLDLKHMNGKANLLLTTHKNFLQKQDENLRELVAEVKHVNKQSAALQKQIAATENQLEKQYEQQRKIKEMMANYQVPDVMEYIRKKNELHDLRKLLKTWKRKTNIQTIAMHTYVKIMCHLSDSPKPKSDWFSNKNVGLEEEIPEVEEEEEDSCDTPPFDYVTQLEYDCGLEPILK